MNQDRNRPPCTEFGSIMYTSVNAIYIFPCWVARSNADLGEMLAATFCYLWSANVSWRHSSLVLGSVINPKTTVCLRVGEDRLVCVQAQHSNFTFASIINSMKGISYHPSGISSAESYSSLECVFSPAGTFWALPLQHRVQAADKRHIYFLTIKLVFISEEMVLLIYLYIYIYLLLLLLLHQPRFSICWQGKCVCVCLIWRAVFRNTKQRRRGKLDPGCIHLGTEGGPSGSLEEAEGRRAQKRNVNIAAKYDHTLKMCGGIFCENMGERLWNADSVK